MQSNSLHRTSDPLTKVTNKGRQLGTIFQIRIMQTLTSDSTLGNDLLRMARGEPSDLSALLQDVEAHAQVNETLVTFHCHCLKQDGNGRLRVADLVEALAEYIIDFAIPRSEILDARRRIETNGSTTKWVRLERQARELFTDLSNTGEGGELLLFALAETVLGLPQLLCKMDLKTNTRMHVHGADGLHAGVSEETGRLLLYWGESKLYASVTDALRECFRSVGPMLKSTGDSGSGKRDLQLLSRHADLENPALTEAFKTYLDPRNEHHNQLEFRGLCLVGYNSDAYPTSRDQMPFDQILSAITESLPELKAAICKRVTDDELLTFSFHTICVPFPSVQEFRDLLLARLKS